MKKILPLLLCLLFLLQTSAFAVPDEEMAITSFKETIQKHLHSYQDDPRIIVFSVSTDTKWLKSKCDIPYDYSYDIQKTNSIITPYTGYLIYKMRVLTTDNQTTKEAAEACNTFNNNDDNLFIKYRILFSYQDNKWIPKKYEFNIPILGNWIDVTGNTNHVGYTRMLVKE
ncbi:MAG: hypothetical protein H6Q69_818 [Firmicutes bacterium]|nr:hypothetical protein [Bacillota bacterium]